MDKGLFMEALRLSAENKKLKAIQAKLLKVVKEERDEYLDRGTDVCSERAAELTRLIAKATGGK